MEKILVITGPTATGKTDLALKLAKEFSGEIISCDSRQVYKGMDIVTGKDIPQDFIYYSSEITFHDKKIGYYSSGETKLWLLDVVEPNKQFSVSDYYDLTWQVIEDCWRRGKLPIIVGVTGFYLKALVQAYETIGVPMNTSLRQKLDQLSISDLQKELAKIDQEKLDSFNESDQQNPRRLVRAIEVAEYRKTSYIEQKRPIKKMDVLGIGLTAPFEELYERIDKRVDQRIEGGAVEEAKTLKETYGEEVLKKYGTGYSDLLLSINGEIPLDEATQHWKFQEHNDARKQLMFLKKLPFITWFDLSTPNVFEEIKKKIAGWYIISV